MGFKKAITSTYLWEVVSPPWKWVKRKKTAYMRKASVTRMLRTNGKDHKKNILLRSLRVFKYG